MSDVLKKPVHLAIIKPSHINKLAREGRITDTAFGLPVHTEHPPLPVEKKERNVSLIPKLQSSVPDLVKQNKKRVQLKVLHENAKKIPEDKKPPCNSCKTAACCYAFIVNISELEYESGVYGDSAIKLTPEIAQQLRAAILLPMIAEAPWHRVNEDSYYLEGKIGQPCPFLDEKSRCGIYDIRPLTCRVYTCVDDNRITEGMRQGTEPLDALSPLRKLNLK